MHLKGYIILLITDNNTRLILLVMYSVSYTSTQKCGIITVYNKEIEIA